MESKRLSLQLLLLLLLFIIIIKGEHNNHSQAVDESLHLLNTTIKDEDDQRLTKQAFLLKRPVLLVIRVDNCHHRDISSTVNPNIPTMATTNILTSGKVNVNNQSLNEEEEEDEESKEKNNGEEKEKEEEKDKEEGEDEGEGEGEEEEKERENEKEKEEAEAKEIKNVKNTQTTENKLKLNKRKTVASQTRDLSKLRINTNILPSYNKLKYTKPDKNTTQILEKYLNITNVDNVDYKGISRQSNNKTTMRSNSVTISISTMKINSRANRRLGKAHNPKRKNSSSIKNSSTRKSNIIRRKTSNKLKMKVNDKSSGRKNRVKSLNNNKGILSMSTRKRPSDYTYNTSTIKSEKSLP